MKAPALIGRTIAGRFTITGFLREGAMAAVYRATQPAEPHDVAIKVMLPQLLSDPTFVGRFRREAKAAARLQHPNTVGIIDYGVDGRLPYIAMELLLGQDLYEMLVLNRRLPEVRTAKILLQVCDALSAAHEQGIVHRDLKPENIMLLRDSADPNVDHVKVLDFGIAKILERELSPDDALSSTFGQSALTMAGVIVGTPAYMSPEQCKGEAVDARSDIYSCGVLLYHLITGRLPFAGETPVDIATKHLREPPPAPTMLVPGLHPGLEATILTALSKRPAERQSSAAELRAELERVLPELRATSSGTSGAQAIALPRLDSDALKTLPRGALNWESSPHPTPRMFRPGPSIETSATQPSMQAVRPDQDGSPLSHAAPTPKALGHGADTPPPVTSTAAPMETEITAKSAQGAPSKARPRIGGDTLRTIARPTTSALASTASAISVNHAAAVAEQPLAPSPAPAAAHQFTPDDAPRVSGTIAIPTAQGSGPGFATEGDGPTAPAQAPSAPAAIHASPPHPIAARIAPTTRTAATTSSGASDGAPLTTPSPLARPVPRQRMARVQVAPDALVSPRARPRPAPALQSSPSRGPAWLPWLIVPIAIAIGVLLGFVAFGLVR
jgi:serine/threonine protein kinase